MNVYLHIFLYDVYLSKNYILILFIMFKCLLHSACPIVAFNIIQVLRTVEEAAVADNHKLVREDPEVLS